MSPSLVGGLFRWNKVFSGCWQPGRLGVTAVATSVRTPFLSVASVEADAMLVAVISIWIYWPGPSIAGAQYECIYR